MAIKECSLLKLNLLRMEHEKLREYYIRVSRELSEADNDDEDEEYTFKPRAEWTREDENFYAVVQHLQQSEGSTLREVHDAIWRLWKDVEAQICEITGEEVDERCPLTGKVIYW